MRLRDWGRRTTPEEFPLQYRAQFHAESVFQCEDPQTGYHGLTFVRRRGRTILISSPLATIISLSHS